MSAPAVDEHLARRLVDSQFPQWADLPVTPVEHGGVDNRTFRLGERMTVRLPSADWYALQVAKEQRWLPVLAPRLPLPIPTPVARGAPGEGYPYAWSVYRWLEGEIASESRIADLTEFATTLAGFLVALGRVEAADGPGPGRHNFFRGGPLTTYADETIDAIEALGDEIPGDAARRVWDDAVAATWEQRSRLVPRRRRGGEPAAARRPAGGGDRLRHVRRRRPRLRRRDRLDPAVRPEPGRLPRRPRRRSRHVVARPRLGAVEGAHHPRRRRPTGGAVQRRVIERVLADHAREA